MRRNMNPDADAWEAYDIFGKRAWRKQSTYGKVSVEPKPGGYVLFVGGKNFGKYKSATAAKRSFDTSMWVPGSGGWVGNPKGTVRKRVRKNTRKGGFYSASHPKIDLMYRVPGEGSKLPSVAGLYSSGSAGPRDWSYHSTSQWYPTIKEAVAAMRAQHPEYAWRGVKQHQNPPRRRNGLPAWPGASGAYTRAYRILEGMARAGHVQPITKGHKSRRAYRSDVSDDMRDFIDALNKGDEERIKGYNLQYARFDSKHHANPAKHRRNPELVWKKGATWGQYEAAASGRRHHSYIVTPAYSFGSALPSYYSVRLWRSFSDSDSTQVGKHVNGLAAAKALAQDHYDRTGGE